MTNSKNNRWRLRFAAAAVGAALLLPLLAVPASAQTANAQTSDVAELPTQGTCVGKSGILVASDAQAQSDVYAAVTLKGVTGGCLIWAGARDSAEIPADQQNRIIASDGVAYIVGGPAAVSASKQVAAAALSNGETATRIGGADRFETAELVGAEATRLAEAAAADADADADADDMTDSDDAEPAAVVETADLGSLTGNRSHTAPAGQSEVTATTAAARWRITAQSQVPAAKRLDASFGPTLTFGECFEEIDGPGDKTDRHRFVWNIKADPNGGCDEAENRSVTVSVSAGDLDDYSDGGDGEPDWGFAVSFERRPAVNVPAPTSVTTTTRETLTPTVTVPKTGDKTTRQVIRLGQGGWLLHVIDQATGGLNAATPQDLSAEKYGVTIRDVAAIYDADAGYDDADRYDTDRYRCVVAATDEVTPNMETRWQKDGANLNVLVPDPAGGKYTTAATGSAAALPSSVSDALAVWVPRGCAGYIAVEVATPGGTANDDGADDVSRWRVQAIPLKAAS